MKHPARSFRYVNSALATTLAADLAIGRGHSLTQELRVGVSLPVTAEVKLGRKTDDRLASDPKVLDKIVRALWRSGQLRGHRPEHPDEFWHTRHDGWYAGEYLVATPVTLPRNRHASASAELTVWVCSPTDPIVHPENPWEISGTFVFLVEELAKFDWPFSSQISGISSLRLAMEVVDNNLTTEQIQFLPSTLDQFSELVHLDPIDKLVRAGGHVGVPRPISAVYKVAYMNDEQGWHHGEKFLRANDILAYPLYIVSQ